MHVERKPSRRIDEQRLKYMLLLSQVISIGTAVRSPSWFILLATLGMVTTLGNAVLMVNWFPLVDRTVRLINTIRIPRRSVIVLLGSFLPPCLATTLLTFAFEVR